MADKSELKIVKNHIDRKMRVGKLDSALLFLCSSFGLIFSFLQAYLGGIYALLYFLPVIILGWILPFFIGYIRGAIFQDSAVERSRGWIYLIVGTGLYLSNLITYIARKFLSDGLVYQVARVFFSVAPLFVSFFIAKRQDSLVKKIFDICNEEVSKVKLRATDYAGWAAFYFSMAGYLSSTLSFEIISLEIAFLFLLLLVSGFFMEYKSTRYINRIEKPFEIYKKKGKPRLALLGKIITIGAIIFLAIFINLNFSKDFFIVYVFIICLFSIGFLVYMVFVPEK
jgi:hypothetical protein